MHTDAKPYDKNTRRKTETALFAVYAVIVLLAFCYNIFQAFHLKYHMTQYIEGSNLISGSAAIMALYSLISGFTCLILAIPMIISSHIGLRHIHQRRGFLYIGFMMLCISQWIMAGNPVGKTFYGNGDLAQDVTFAALLGITVPLLMYINYLEFNRFSRFFDNFCIGLIVFNTVLLILYFATDIRTAYLFVAAIVEHLLSFAIIFLSFFLLYRGGEKTAPGHIAMIIGTAALAATTGYELVAAASIEAASSKVVLATGVNIYLICAMISVVSFFTSRQNETALTSAKAEARNKFVYNISSQIRTPIRTSMEMLDLITPAENSGEEDSLAEEARSSVKNLLAGVDDMLTFVQSENGEMAITRGKYYSADLLADISSLSDVTAFKTGVRIDVNADVTIPRALFGDKPHIARIIINLINHCLSRKPASRIDVDLTFVTETDLGLCLACQITDDAPTMTSEELLAARRVIDAGNSLLAAEEQDVTIGLAIAAGLTRQMKGGLEISVNGKGGNVATLAIPQEVIDGHPVGNVKEAIKERRNLTAAGKPESAVRADAAVLLADDSSVNRRVLIRLLNSFGIDPMVVTDGEAALRLTSKRTFDMIFLDEDLPGISVSGCLSAMRENDGRYEDTPAVLLSAALGPADAAAVHTMGFAEVLPRPYRREVLHEILLKYLPDA